MGVFSNEVSPEITKNRDPCVLCLILHSYFTFFLVQVITKDGIKCQELPLRRD